MRRIKLTISICSLHERTAKLTRLLLNLSQQPRVEEVQIVVNIDHRRHLLAEKRNQLLQQASGEYIVHIDDDDNVHPEYISKILDAIERNPGVDAIAVRGRRVDLSNTLPPTVFDYRLMDWRSAETDKDGVLWRNPGHICPIKTEIARSHAFPVDLVEPEDVEWSQLLAPQIKTCARAGLEGEVLYHYLWNYYANDMAERAKLRTQLNEAHMIDHQSIFSSQYTERSGPGSTLEFSAPYRKFIERFIIENQVKSIIDLGCGDAEVMGNIDLHGSVYVGVDVIEERVHRNRLKYPHLSFEHNDLRKAIVRADLILCKDVIQHWSNAEIIAWLIELQVKPFKYALVTNCNYGNIDPRWVGVNEDAPTGSWRPVDLTKQPFFTYCDPRIVFSWGDPNKDVVLIKGVG